MRARASSETVRSIRSAVVFEEPCQPFATAAASKVRSRRYSLIRC